MKKKSEVLRIPPANPETALAHFSAQLVFETDCWDVHASLHLDDPGFVLLDVRSQELYGQGHVEGATNLPNWEISPRRLTDYPADTLFVVYCAGSHCNGATKAAIRLARLDRPVKLMIGGVEGWKDEGFPLAGA
jgi:rhodanese-related sulfurtransferase